MEHVAIDKYIEWHWFRNYPHIVAFMMQTISSLIRTEIAQNVAYQFAFILLFFFLLIPRK